MIKQNNYMMDIYGSSPTNMYDYQPIFDFDDNLIDTDQLPSIKSDVEKVVKTPDNFYDDFIGIGDVFGNCMEDDDVIFFKKDLQFVDCMWSATASCSKNGGVNNSNSNNCNGNNNNTQIASAASSYSESGALPPAIVTGTTLITDTEAAALRLVSSNSSSNSSSSSSASSSSSSSTSSSSTTTPPIVIKQEPLDHFDLSGSSNSSSGSNTAHQQQQQQRRKYNNSYDKENKRNGNGHINGGSNVKFTDIPPGGSLLRKSCQKSTTGRNNATTKCTRPDTPFSPHDEISTCIKGSNNISLSAALSASDFIDHLSRELQNTTKKRISLPFHLTQGGGDINEVLDVLDELSSQQQDTIMTTTTTPTAATTTTNGSSGIGCSLSLAIDDSGCSSSNSVNMTSPPPTSSDCDSDGGDCSMGENSSCSREFSTSSSMRYKNLRHHISDHSYTRCNEMADEHPPLETPSDSDEEIDVVTLTDKKLPTNPSDRDLGALQYQVAHKMIWNGSKKFSHPCYEFSTPASISPVKSVANLSSASSSSSSSSSSTASYSPKNAYNFSNDDYDFGQSSLTSALKMPTASVASATMGKGRKRYFVNLTEANSDEVRPKLKPTSSSSSSASSTTSTPMINKRCRSKKFAATNATNRNNNVSPSNMDMVFPTLGGVASGANGGSGGSSSSSNSGTTTPTPAMLKRQYSLDEADTIEKRNQHNDMERQRRIGLKNLFEALKKQIPTIRDKERAPKVNILREAAKLCQQLTEDEHTLEKQLQKLREKQRAQQELLHRLRSLKTE